MCQTPRLGLPRNLRMITWSYLEKKEKFENNLMHSIFQNSAEKLQYSIKMYIKHRAERTRGEVCNLSTPNIWYVPASYDLTSRGIWDLIFSLVNQKFVYEKATMPYKGDVRKVRGLEQVRHESLVNFSTLCTKEIRAIWLMVSSAGSRVLWVNWQNEAVRKYLFYPCSLFILGSTRFVGAR